MKVPKLANYIRDETFLYKKEDYKIINDVDSNDMQPLIKEIFEQTVEIEQINELGKKVKVKKLVERNISLNIDGRAGTGKTTLIRLLQEELTRKGKSFISLATTNKAARFLKDGKTIYMFSMQYTMKFIKECKANYIFIDEISMMEEKFSSH